MCEAERSDNFIIGLTNVSPTVTVPTLWNYAVCGQYPGAVGVGTVSLQCTYNTGMNSYTTPVSRVLYLQCTCNMTAYRYVIVQFPSIDYSNFCELEVYVRRKLLYRHSVIYCAMYFLKISGESQKVS